MHRRHDLACLVHRRNRFLQRVLGVHAHALQFPRLRRQIQRGFPTAFPRPPTAQKLPRLRIAQAAATTAAGARHAELHGADYRRLHLRRRDFQDDFALDARRSLHAGHRGFQQIREPHLPGAALLFKRRHRAPAAGALRNCCIVLW
jgi:hypothetical protein